MTLSVKTASVRMPNLRSARDSVVRRGAAVTWGGGGVGGSFGGQI